MNSLNHIGIAGAGTMGRGIAQVFAQAGLAVTLYDVQPEALENARQQIEQTYNNLAEKGKIAPEQKAELTGRIRYTLKPEELKCDVLVEAVAELLSVKQQLFAQFEQVLSAEALVVTNTSSLSVTALSAGLRHPHRFAGLHFFNPAPLMKLVEVVHGELTAPETIQKLVALVKQIGKYPVVVADSPGFIVNRVARPFYTEALKLAEEQVAGIATIDRLIRATGFKMGPFELMDLIGNDINYSVTQSVFQAFSGEPRFRPSRLQELKVKARHLGRKTGKGFYNYDKQ